MHSRDESLGLDASAAIKSKPKYIRYGSLLIFGVVMVGLIATGRADNIDAVALAAEGGNCNPNGVKITEADSASGKNSLSVCQLSSGRFSPRLWKNTATDEKKVTWQSIEEHLLQQDYVSVETCLIIRSVGGAEISVQPFGMSGVVKGMTEVLGGEYQTFCYESELAATGNQNLSVTLNSGTIRIGSVYLTGIDESDSTLPPRVAMYSSVGIIGCSNTGQHANAYEQWSSEDNLWELTRNDIAGGVLQSWYDQIDSPRAGYWDVFRSNATTNPPDAIWFQLCIREDEGSASGIDTRLQNEVLSVITEAKNIAGNVPIFISPINIYAPEGLCEITGTIGVQNANDLVEWAVIEGHAIRGPVTGPLTAELTEGDNCHLNKAGGDTVGPQMVEFFDGQGDTGPIGNDPSDYQSVGVVGCSNTSQHIEGYKKQTTVDKLWPAVGDYSLGGGSLGVWANAFINPSHNKAQTYEALNASHPPDVFWVQICLPTSEISPSGMSIEQQDNLEFVFSEIINRSGNIPIYVSPVNAYSPDDLCSKIGGTVGFDNAVELTDWAVGQGLAERGPVTGPLNMQQTVEDDCHLSEDGKTIVGAQIVEFFD